MLHTVHNRLLHICEILHESSKMKSDTVSSSLMNGLHLVASACCTLHYKNSLQDYTQYKNKAIMLKKIDHKVAHTYIKTDN